MARRSAASETVWSAARSVRPTSIHSRISWENGTPASCAAARIRWSSPTGSRTPRVTIGSSSGTGGSCTKAPSSYVTSPLRKAAAAATTC